MNVLNALDALYFVRPWWFAALIPLAGLLWLLLRGRFSSGSWEAVCDAHLLPSMLLGRMMHVGRRSFLWLTGLAGVLAITALAGPAWERLPQPVMRDDSALVVVFDLSLSMSAVDIKPNRLVRARYKISDLIGKDAHGQTGLVVYARDAFTVVPVTDDSAAIELYLRSLDTRLMPRQGSRADLGLQEAGALLQKVDSELGDVLLVSDYADARAVGQARQLHDKGYKVSVLGVGTESGGPVSLPSGDFLSHQGEVVIPRLEESLLREVAQAGGGAYVHFDPFTDSDVEVLNNGFEVHVTTAQSKRESEVTADTWREEGPWLILLMLPIAALGFRRGLLGVVLAVVACALLVQPRPAYALSWADLWLRPDQQGARALEKDDAERAAELFEDDKWKAAAQYRSGDYAGAVETLKTLDGAVVSYNKGNALAGEGKLKEAMEAYRDALEINPAMDDAVYNMGVVKQLLQMMQQQQMQKGEEGEEGEEGEQQQAQGAKQDQEGDDESQQDSPSPDDSNEGDENERDENEGDESDENEGDENEGDESDQQEEEDVAGEENGDGEESQASSSPLETMTERDQAVEQWLRGVPDDPGRLLKRKLRHLSRTKKRDKSAQGDKPW